MLQRRTLLGALCTTALFFAATSATAAGFASQASKHLPQGTLLGLHVIDAKQGNEYIAQNQNVLLAPGSTQKLAVALASSVYLPNDFSFETKLFKDKQDVIIHFGGDPTLLRKDLKALLAKLKQRGTSKIEGNIWLDDSIFSGYDLAVGLPWDILGVCYSAPTSAITLEGNCVHATLYNNTQSSETRLYVPSHQPITTSSKVKALSKIQQQEANCDLELNANNQNHYQLTGCIPKQDGPFPLKFAVQNPSKYVAAVTKQLLSELGIAFNGKVQIFPEGRKYQGTLIASHASPKRDALLSTMLKDSDNLIADNLLKIMGHRYYRQPGSFINGTKALKAILKEQANIDLTNAVLADGSGLSRNNLMTAGQLAQIMQWIYKNKRQELLAILPTSGIDGTLKLRPSLRNAPIKGRLQAKSGAIFGTYNLVGVLQRADTDLIVVQLVSHYYDPDADKVQEKAQQPIFAFERALYQSLLQQTLPVN